MHFSTVPAEGGAVAVSKYLGQFMKNFDNGIGYFDNDIGQTLFFDGILMDIMVDNGEI